MLPLLWNVVRSYAPVVMLPVAAVIGIIGYHIESRVRNTYTPFKASIEDERDERLLAEIQDEVKGQDISDTTVPHGKQFRVPKSIFERGLSPQLIEPSSHPSASK